MHDSTFVTVKLHRALDGRERSRGGEEDEDDLVDLLRDRGKLLVSMVAQSDSAIVGHIAFSRVVIESHAGLRGVGLAPMGVLPRMQRYGIGSALVQAGLDRCGRLQYEFAV